MSSCVLFARKVTLTQCRRSSNGVGVECQASKRERICHHCLAVKWCNLLSIRHAGTSTVNGCQGKIGNNTPWSKCGEMNQTRSCNKKQKKSLQYFENMKYFSLTFLDTELRVLQRCALCWNLDLWLPSQLGHDLLTDFTSDKVTAIFLILHGNTGYLKLTPVPTLHIHAQFHPAGLVTWPSTRMLCESKADDYIVCMKTHTYTFPCASITYARTHNSMLLSVQFFLLFTFWAPSTTTCVITAHEFKPSIHHSL